MISNSESSSNRDDKQNRTLVIIKYLSYWPLFAVLLLTSLLLAWLFIAKTPPVYQAKTAIIIKDSKKGIEDSKMVDEMNQLSSPTIVENEIEVLRSRMLMREVVDRLSLYAPLFEDTKYYYKRIFRSSPILVTHQMPETIVKTDLIGFFYDAKGESVRIDSISYPLDAWVSTPYGPLKFTKQNVPHKPEGKLFFALHNPKEVVRTLVSSLDVTSNRLSSVIELKMQHENATLAEELLNELLKLYQANKSEKRNALSQGTKKIIEERLAIIKGELDSIDRRIQTYRITNGAIDINSQSKLFLQNLSINDQKISEANYKLIMLKDIEKYLILKKDQGGFSPAISELNDPFLTGLLNNLYQYELEYESLKATTGENNPKLVNIYNKIEKIKPSIVENIASQKKSISSMIENLNNTNKYYNTFLGSLPSQERGLLDISRTRENKKLIFDHLLQKQEDAVFSPLVLGDATVLDNAEADLKPVSPKSGFVYLLACFVSVIIAFIVITIHQGFNGQVKFRSEIESLTRFPIISEIAFSKIILPIESNNINSSLLNEQLRKLQISLSYLGIGPNNKKVLITSTLSGEGKSFLTSNFGLSLAKSGKKVIMLEFDLANPTLSSYIQSSLTPGIAGFLTNNKSLKEVISATKLHPNLFVIPAGEPGDEPSDLISHNRVQDLFDQLCEEFDFVLVDSAPVGILSDGYILSRYCDTTLYIIRYNHTPKLVLERLDDNNKINELKNIALVFNGVSASSYSKYNIGYKYLTEVTKRKYFKEKRNRFN